MKTCLNKFSAKTSNFYKSNNISLNYFKWENTSEQIEFNQLYLKECL